MKDVKLKITDNQELETLVPIDRVVTIDNNGYVYLYDTCILITDNMIEEVL